MKFLLSLAAGALALSVHVGASDKMLVFVGTYTGGPSKGIYTFELSLENGSIREVGLAAEAQNPSFLAIHPNKKFLYAVSEVSTYDGKKTGAVSAFRASRSTSRGRRPAPASGATRAA